MKDQDPKVDHEFELVHVNGKSVQRIITKVVRACKYHLYAKPEDMVDVLIKTTGKTVKRCKYCERTKQENKIMRREELKKDKEELPDYYILKTLRIGKGGLKANDVPPALIEAKRAVMKIKNLQQKLEEPLKTCHKHGKLYKDDVIKSGKSQWTGDQKWKCKQCMKEMHKRNYELNKLKINLKAKNYRAKNPEKVRSIKLASRRKKQDIENEKSRARWEKWEKENPGKVREMNARVKKSGRAELTDSYVKQGIVKRTGLKHHEIPQELVDAKRAIMMLKRQVKTKIDHDKILIRMEERQSGKNK